MQAPDLSWNKLKGLVTKLYDEWLANGVQEYTKQRNLRRPPRKLIVEWIMDAWNKLVEKSRKYQKVVQSLCP